MKFIDKSTLSGAFRFLTVAMLSIFLVACSSSGASVGGNDAGVDSDGDTEFEEGNDADGACEGQVGSDADSSDFLWRNNCTLGVSIETSAPFYNSTYAEGIQRILYCSGVADAADDNAYTNGLASFADGLYGNKTKEAVRAFQTAENAFELAAEAEFGDSRGQLDVNGIVGPDTWERLQSKVELYEDDSAFIDFDGNFEVFGILTSDRSFGRADCSADKHFYGDSGDGMEGINSWLISNEANSSLTKRFGT